MATNITETELRAILRDRVKTHGRKQVAKDCEVDPNYISMLLHPTKPRSISDEVADKLGYKMHRVEQRMYEPKA